MTAGAKANRFKAPLVAAALATLTLAGSCTDAGDEANPTATRDDGTRTLAAVVGDSDRMATLQAALEESELSGVLDGPASYTLLAPNDAAFAALGEQGALLMAEDRRPLLIGVLRDHLLPGHLTPEAIAAAVAAQDGPVIMTTLGEGEVRFSRQGDRLVVSSGEGGAASFAGPAVAANNGVMIPIDGLLLPPGAN